MIVYDWKKKNCRLIFINRDKFQLRKHRRWAAWKSRSRCSKLARVIRTMIGKYRWPLVDILLVSNRKYELTWILMFRCRRGGSEENFVVHRVKGVPTLSSVADEKFSSRAEAAGRPSNWEDQRRSSYAGRRSRRNSVTDDSQLTIENFGGSQVKLY